MAADAKKVHQRYLALKAERDPRVERWERMAPYIAPSRVGMLHKISPSDKQTINVFDSTTMMASELMAMFIAGHIINPSQLWFGYMMEDEIANEDDEVREWLEEVRDLSLKRLSASLFYAVGPECLIDYGGFGTGCFIAEETPISPNIVKRGFRGFTFTAEKTGRFLIAEGVDGLIDTLFREYEMSARNIAERWPDGNLPEKVRSTLVEGKPDTAFKIVHAIYPRPSAEQGAGATGMPWASCWLELDSKTLIAESGYRVFPAAIPRYHLTPGEVFGRGRGDLAFPDAWTLNTAKRMGLEDWALKIRPPVLHAHDSVFGTLKLTPGGPTSINSHGKSIRDVIMPFETGSHPEVSQINEENLRMSIRQIFFVDQILKLLEVSKSEMTAFEFAKKIELLFRILGPVYGRLEWEFLHRVVDLIFDIQLAAGAFPPPPPGVFQTNGVLNIRFQNPIAKAQRAGDVEALTLTIADIAPLAQIKEDMLDWLDTDKAMKGIIAIRGVPAKWQRSDDEVTALRAARQEAQQQQMQLDQLAQGAEAVGKAAPALKMIQGAKQ